MHICKIFQFKFGQEVGCVDELSDTLNNSTGGLMGINGTSSPIKCDDCFLLTTVETSTTQQVRAHGQS